MESVERVVDAGRELIVLFPCRYVYVSPVIVLEVVRGTEVAEPIKGSERTEPFDCGSVAIEGCIVAS